MLDAIERRALAALRPPPRQKLSDWIEGNVYLPDGVSALPGPVRLWPFQREIADAIGDPAIERVTIVKAVRCGFTTLLTSAIGSFIANDPAPILVVLPTEADCRSYVVNDVEQIFAASPVLAGVLGDSTGRNTLLSRLFPGGSLKVVAAKAPRNLRGHNARVLFVDEVDAAEITAEGPPVALAERRTLSFADRKIVIGSTPVFEETSYVLRSYALSDQRVYEVPCLDCRGLNEIQWKDIQWPEGQPHLAHYVCPSCGSVIDERHKPEMVEAGLWRATRPEVTDHAGFRLNALVSLLGNASWGKLATEFVTAKSDAGMLQVFVNTILAEGWREQGEEIDDAALARRAEPFSLDMLPEEVLAITAGVDVQRDRLEATLIGHSRDNAMFVLGHVVIWGLPEHDTTWAALDDLLKTRFQHPYGGKLAIDAAAVDSGDGETMEHVYRFCWPRAGRRVLAIKGVAGNRPFIERTRQKNMRGALWIVGVDGIKAHLAARLTRGTSIRFSNTLPASWYEQLASERAVVRFTMGQPKRRFERIPGRQAEALDCTVYATAARQILTTLNWDARAEALRNPEITAAPVVRPRVIRSAWVES